MKMQNYKYREAFWNN